LVPFSSDSSVRTDPEMTNGALIGILVSSPNQCVPAPDMVLLNREMALLAW
jgi:hypothetical protein